MITLPTDIKGFETLVLRLIAELEAVKGKLSIAESKLSIVESENTSLKAEVAALKARNYLASVQ
jgi:hypothetical protein